VLTRLDVRDAGADLKSRLGAAQRTQDDPAIVARVRGILHAVRDGGDRALRDATTELDGVTLDDLRVGRDQCVEAAGGLPDDLRAALETVAGRIRSYHERQVGREGAPYDEGGVTVRELVRPVDRAGLYVPGGRAAYPSTVLMTAIPALVAGVGTRVLCVPPGRDGQVPAVTLAAALLTGVEEIYRVGGAQAIGAMAYGTETIDPVDVVVGPGNVYVDVAKRLVAAEGIVGIDGPAGPSELVVIADSTADPRQVALDLAAQAEHGPGGRAILLSWEPDVLDAVVDGLTWYLAEAARAEEIQSTLTTCGMAVVVADAAQALAVANLLAAEHLELHVRDAEPLLAEVRHAGAVFVRTPTALGDYAAGPNHVLPTGGTARFAEALRVDDFRKHIHVVEARAGEWDEIAEAGRVLARAEGLDAHADSLARRIHRP
jgi:histidinol dehydrogenase